MRKTLPAIAALGVWMSCLPAAWAAPVSADAQRDATAVAHAIFQAVDMQTVLLRSIQENFDDTRMQMPRPEWNALFKQAFTAELARHMPDMEASFGRTIAGNYADVELRAGAAFFRSRPGLHILSNLKAKASGAATTDLTPEEQAELRTSAKDPALSGFMAKFGKGMQIDPSATQDFIALILPDVFIRFGMAAKEAEARRSASPAP